MVLKIDYEVFKLVRAESEQFWLDHYTYLIVDKESDEAEFIETPIPFPFTEKTKLQKLILRHSEKSSGSFLTASRMKMSL